MFKIIVWLGGLRFNDTEWHNATGVSYTCLIEAQGGKSEGRIGSAVIHWVTDLHVPFLGSEVW